MKWLLLIAWTLGVIFASQSVSDLKPVPKLQWTERPLTLLDEDGQKIRLAGRVLEVRGVIDRVEFSAGTQRLGGHVFPDLPLEREAMKRRTVYIAVVEE